MFRGNGGFSLIELVVVISIIAVVVSIAMLSLKNPTESLVLRTEANKIAQAIRLAQEMAVSRGENYCFEIDTREKFYRVRPKSGLGKTVKVEYIDFRISEIECTFESPYSNKNIKVLTFTPTGIPGRTGSIKLRTESGAEKTITVAVGTGRVVIK